MDRPRVLVAEDEPHIRRTLCFILERDGMEVLQAADGEEALDHALRERPDLVLMDVMMPRRDGLEVLRLLRETDGFESTPVILLTALAESRDKVRAFEHGADDYLTKPFNPKEVTARVQAQLRMRKMQQDMLDVERDRVALATAGAVAHEMSQPLTVIMGNLQLLLMKLPAGDPMRVIVEKIVTSGERAVSLLHRLQGVHGYAAKSYLDSEILDLDRSSQEELQEGNDAPKETTTGVPVAREKAGGQE